jgi:hypothetical protein
MTYRLQNISISGCVMKDVHVDYILSNTSSDQITYDMKCMCLLPKLEGHEYRKANSVKIRAGLYVHCLTWKILLFLMYFIIFYVHLTLTFSKGLYFL